MPHNYHYHYHHHHLLYLQKWQLRTLWNSSRLMDPFPSVSKKRKIVSSFSRSAYMASNMASLAPFMFLARFDSFTWNFDMKALVIIWTTNNPITKKNTHTNTHEISVRTKHTSTMGIKCKVNINHDHHLHGKEKKRKKQHTKTTGWSFHKSSHIYRHTSKDNCL